jgi:hypothetical protein
MTTARQLFVQDPVTKRIRFTQAGIAKYQKKFSRVGFNIKTIRTLSEFESAVDASFAAEMQDLSETAKDDPALAEALKGLPGWE